MSMNNISIESVQEFAIATGVTILIITFVIVWVAMFVIAGLKLMFRIMDKIEKKSNSKDSQKIVDLALRFDENGNVLPQKVIKSPMPTTSQQTDQK